MKKLIAYCWRSIDNRRRYCVYMLAALLSALVSVVLPLVVGCAINNLVVMSDTPSTMHILCITLAGALLLGATMQFVSTLLHTYLQADSSYALERRAIQTIQRRPYEHLHGLDGAYWRRRLDDDTNGVTLFFLMSLTETFSSVLALGVSTVLLSAINLAVGLSCTCLALLSGSVYLCFRKTLSRREKCFYESLSSYSAESQRQISSSVFVKSHALFSYSADRLDCAYWDVRQAMYLSNRASAFMHLLVDLLSGASQVALLLLGAYEMTQGRMQVGFISTTLGYFSTIASSMKEVVQFGAAYQSALINYQRLQEVERFLREPSGEVCLSRVDAIELCDVTLSYSKDAVPVLSNFSHTFVRGQLCVLAGANGVGKTTLLKVIAGRYAGFYQGELRINGHPFETMNRDAYRSQTTCYVEQDPLLVPGTIWENLSLFGGDCVREDDAVVTVERLGAGGLCTAGSLHRDLGDGSSLSGGERQKVATARALLSRPSVLLLDEPTSALDADGRTACISLLREYARHAVVVVVTHDEELISAADEVVWVGGEV